MKPGAMGIRVITYVLALRDSTKSNLNLSLSQDIGGGGHVDQEVCRGAKVTSVSLETYKTHN